MTTNYVTGRKYNVELKDITVKTGFNKRQFNDKYQEKIDSLAESISEVGIREPLKAEVDSDGLLSLINGESRYRACQQLAGEGITVKIPVVIASYKSDKERLIDQGLSNKSSEFTTYEIALLFKSLQDEGMTHTEIAKTFGVSQPTVSNRLKLLTLPQELIDQVIDGSISADNAVKLHREHGEGAAEIASKAANESVTKKASKKSIDGATNKGNGKPKLKDLVTEALSTENISSYHDGTQVSITIPQELYLQLLEIIE